MSGPLKVPGVEMTFDGAVYVVPALNAAAVKQYRQEVARYFEGGLPDLELAARLLHCAMSRNYPNLQPEAVEQWVTFGNVVHVMDTLMNTSGLAAQVGELSRRIQAAMNPSGSKT